MIVCKGTTPNGTRIQVENWTADYPDLCRAYVIGSYPISKHSLGGFGPRIGKTFRCSFSIKDFEETRLIFEKLKDGTMTLLDLEAFADRLDYFNCIHV